MLPQLSPWDLNGALARTCEAAGAALQQMLTRELAEWKGLALAVRPRWGGGCCVWGDEAAVGEGVYVVLQHAVVWLTQSLFPHVPACFPLVAI